MKFLQQLQLFLYTPVGNQSLAVHHRASLATKTTSLLSSHPKHEAKSPHSLVHSCHLCTTPHTLHSAPSLVHQMHLSPKNFSTQLQRAMTAYPGQQYCVVL